MENGKPRFGYYFDTMKQTRAQFKLALRYCRDNVEATRADACAQKVFDTDPHRFWRNVQKFSNSKANAHVVSVGGVTGEHNVAEMWKDHFEKLYNSKKDSKYWSVLESKLLDTLPSHGGPTISVTDIYDCVINKKLIRR